LGANRFEPFVDLLVDALVIPEVLFEIFDVKVRVRDIAATDAVQQVFEEATCRPSPRV
jgi:hypothetical protein